MPRKYKAEHSSGYTILLVDDDPEYLEATTTLLEREGHHVLTATNGPDALSIIQSNRVDLLLLDYFMPQMTGEQVVVELRKFNHFVQVILQTGYASEQPPRELLKRLDIQGYYDKSENLDKLLLWTDVGLKAAYTIQLLYNSRQGLRYILDVTPELHKIQPLDDLLQGILWQIAGLFGAVNSFLAVLPKPEIMNPTPEPDAFLAIVGDDTELIIHVGIGRFAGEKQVDECLEPLKLDLVRQTMCHSEICIADNATIVPLQVGKLNLGVVYLDRPVIQEYDKELLQVFANQAAVAIQNVQLYEMATLDSLSNVYARGFLEQCMLRELRTAFRNQIPITLLMLDMDGLKRINDVAGHLAGDQAITTLGKVLHQATRTSDVVGRYGGDEFAIVLPNTDIEGAERVVRRIMDALRDKSIPSLDGEIPLSVSIGLSVLEPHTFAAASIPRPVLPAYFDRMSEALIQQADRALYQAKQLGGSRISKESPTTWLPVA